MNAAVKLYGAAAALGLFALWWVSRGSNAQALASGAVGVANQAATGAVLGIGEVVGVPATNTAQCQRDKAAGNFWAASFSCPAGDYLGIVAGAPVAAVVAAGRTVGIPATSKTQCQIDRENGDLWAASFSCPALDFLGAAWNSTVISQAAAKDAAVSDLWSERIGGGASGGW